MKSDFGTEERDREIKREEDKRRLRRGESMDEV